MDLNAIAHTLDEAQALARETEQLDAELHIDQAYEIQSKILTARTERGENYIGPKLGFTSKAKMEQMGVNNIIVGFLTDSMHHAADEPLSLDGLIHPRIEPELVFKVGQEITPNEGESAEELAKRLREATTHVAAGMEVIDSRYKNFKFSLADVVADNTSAAKFIVGDWQEFPREVAGLDVKFLIDGEEVGSATTDAILGNPLEAFDQLAEMILKYGFEVPAGAVILAGSVTAAQWLKPGQNIEARIEGFEPLQVAIAG